MIRRRRANPPEEDEPGIDISSMIDMCFLLLIYFMVSNSIDKKEQDLNMQLPSAAPSDGTPPEIRPLFIRLDANGFISIRADGAPEELVEQDPDTRVLSNLSPRLELYSSAARGSNSEPLVQVHVDGEAKQQRVIDVLNALAGAGISKVTFTDLVDGQD